MIRGARMAGILAPARLRVTSHFDDPRPFTPREEDRPADRAPSGAPAAPLAGGGAAARPSASDASGDVAGRQAALPLRPRSTGISWRGGDLARDPGARGDGRASRGSRSEGAGAQGPLRSNRQDGASRHPPAGGPPAA